MLNSIFHQRNGRLTEELALGASPLGRLPKRLMPDATVDSTCGFCSTGCALTVHVKDSQAVNVTPTVNYPVNLGKACPKGWEALTPLKARDRATTPLLRDESGKLVPVSWDTALKTLVGRFKEIQYKHGNQSVAFISTGQICTEEMMLLGSLAKFGMGMIHGDGNTRQCMATSVAAYKQAFGFDAPPFTYKDFEESDCIVFVGANPCIAHPIMWERVCMNKNDPEIIVIDPRRTETAMAATRHYAITPKSDLILLYAIANILIEKNWCNTHFIADHTNDFENFKLHVQKYTPEMAARATGLSVKELYEFASKIYLSKRVSFWWTMGVNQSHEGTRTAQAIINLALMTGNIGRLGTGANSITGQCNAMGSRLFSNTTNLLGGHDFLNPHHRRKIAKILNIDESRIPQQNSLAYDQIIDEIPVNRVKGLWVIATNPAHSWIGQNEFRETIRQLDFLVVQDMYATTEMAQMADLVLPAAGWGEKEGTFINSERRIGLVQKAAKAPGQALSDFNIFKLVAEYWGCADLFKDWKKPEDVFQSMKTISRDTPCDISGIKDYQMLRNHGGIQWPLPQDTTLTNNERRLFEDGKFYHPDGRARFVFEDSKAPAELPDEEYPFFLLTGRGTSSQWHTQTRTAKSPVLRTMYPKDIYVEINPQDASALGVQQNQWVFVRTKRGALKARARIMTTVKPGQIFIPMHYEETNRLTLPAFDPYSRQPSYKICAASVSRGEFE